MEKIKIESKTRDSKTDIVKKLRQQGMIPAELYGHGVGNVHLTLDQNTFEKVLRQAGESTIIELIDPEGKTHNVLIHEVQKHYLTSQPIHVDFYEVKMTERLTATVELQFVGESKAVRELGGTLVKVLTEIEVECLPADLPSHIDVDISAIKSFDDDILVKNLKVDDKVTIKAEPEEMVAKVQPPRDMEAELAAEEVSEADAVAAAVGADTEGEAAAGAEGAEAAKEPEAKEEK
jgi:large subunit ribosomal protein L25